LASRTHRCARGAGHGAVMLFSASSIDGARRFGTGFAIGLAKGTYPKGFVSGPVQARLALGNSKRRSRQPA
jgi:hypothetical protein